MLHLSPTLSLANLEENMVPIEGGIFDMGGESGFWSAKPIHKVQLDDFFLCRYPVSQQLWKEVMGENPERLKFENRHRPVDGVSWEDIIQDFLPRLQEKPGYESYFLPTEAQWEYAARGGKYAVGTAYAGSNHVKEVAWYNQNSFSETQVIGQKRPNQLGLFDMSGNVREWCQDWMSRSYYQELQQQYGSQPAPNPGGPKKGSSRVVRGGSWYLADSYARVSDRYDSYPNVRDNFIGFRLCRYSPR